jgi:hypothetical protein
MTEKKGVPYDGPSGVARDSDWLNSEDLIKGKDQQVKIEKVLRRDNHKFEGGGKKDEVIPVYLSLKFEGKGRELGLNATNRKILSKMFGSRTGAWIGKTITLYVTQCLAWGETVDCVRIRDTGSRPATAAEAFLDDAEAKASAPAPTAAQVVSIFGAEPAAEA